ncbi:hypothetical protein [Caulobacter hibisci]|uniref:Lipoprotein n=1 Tax=Caulobacter hibisci TaxID=2035993 RepID=A0ABS0SWN1_9CAUL|nr:hypothetical protein [Caulobacter hibisci]MBI1684011.1 hypothetical protein [Caulobacter hibisci]
MRLTLSLAVLLVMTGCTTITYNCNVPGSCPGVQKAGLSATLINKPEARP